MFSFSKTKRTPQMARLQGMALSEEALEGVVGGVGAESGEGAEDPTAAEQMQEQLESAADGQSSAGGVSTPQEELQKLLKQMEELTQQATDGIPAGGDTPPENGGDLGDTLQEMPDQSAQESGWTEPAEGTDTLNGEEVPPQEESATENQAIASFIDGGFDNVTEVLPDGLVQTEEIPAVSFEENQTIASLIDGDFDNVTVALPGGPAQTEETPAMRVEESPVLGATVIDAASVRPQDGTGEEFNLTKLVNLAQNLQGDSPDYGGTAAEFGDNDTINLTDLVREADLFRRAGVR